MPSVSELQVMRMLSNLEGRYLYMERYVPSMVASLEQPEFQLSASELHKILRKLEAEGMVASVCEQLNGLLFALTQDGRKLMSAEGFLFNAEHVGQTRALFEKWHCKESM